MRSRIRTPRRFPGKSREEIVAYLAARAALGRPISSLEAVYLKNRGICALCSTPVDWHLPLNHPMRASRDHVVQRRLGGTETRSNLRLAHQKCNEERERSAPSLPPAAAI